MNKVEEAYDQKADTSHRVKAWMLRVKIVI